MPRFDRDPAASGPVVQGFANVNATPDFPAAAELVALSGQNRRASPTSSAT